MNILVMGGAGFIGSHIVDALIRNGHQVCIFDLPNISLDNLSHHQNNIKIFKGDFNNSEDISGALEGVECVVHLISTTLPGPSNKNPVYDVESNLVGTLNLLKKACEQGIKKIVFASSGGTVYGVPESLPIEENHATNPICSYGICKLAIEKYLFLYNHLYGLDFSVLRLSNPYGPRQRSDNVQGAIAVFLGKIIKGDPITIWGDGSVARDYFYIDDLAAAFINTIEKKSSSKIFNIGSGHAVSLRELLKIIEQVTKKKLRIEFLPARKLDVQANCLDVGLVETELGWRPQVSLEEGIERTWQWMKKSI